MIEVLVRSGRLVKATDAVAYDPEVYSEMVTAIVRHCEIQDTITVAEARTMFETSRKYALALLEHLDAAKVTRREGDARVLR
ncbi:MAG: SelB C-terminal domain-containing protein [Chloroflexia bacterium]